MIYSITLAGLVLFATSALGQVINDSISHRLSLAIGEPYTSNTAHCTVESSCVDESLTGKCIKYHNDQWFTFNANHYSKLFINVANQHCQDLLGVQLVVIDGQACQPDSYQILSCVSLGSNDDYYVEIATTPHKEYLLNIDGYLHDFCQFSISIDTVAKGLPPAPNLSIAVEATSRDSIVEMRWSIPDSLKYELASFIIYHRVKHQFSFDSIASLTVERNAFGEVKQEYFFTDTLQEHRLHFYRLVGVAYTAQQYLIDEFSFTKPRERNTSTIALDFPENTPITITIWNHDTTQVLEQHRLVFSKNSHASFPLNLSRYYEKEPIVIVEIQDQTSGKSTLKKVVIQ